ncbi:hypothetical protein [Burkholderia cenocepacia]|uniref:hypothetical protein n=1 Tax=Burkholderia cenocepacia TaxID=95486 RepID=UPI000F599523|nr:hypothetical protein [Burkholderia cenocepacia]
MYEHAEKDAGKNERHIHHSRDRDDLDYIVSDLESKFNRATPFGNLISLRLSSEPSVGAGSGEAENQNRAQSAALFSLGNKGAVKRGVLPEMSAFKNGFRGHYWKHFKASTPKSASSFSVSSVDAGGASDLSHSNASDVDKIQGFDTKGGRENELPMPPLVNQPINERQSPQLAQPNVDRAIPKIAHFHLYLSPVSVVVDDGTLRGTVSDCEHGVTRQERKYKINVRGALGNIADFIGKNPDYTVHFWTNKDSEGVIKKIMLDAGVSSAFFKKIKLSCIDDFFDAWSEGDEGKSLIYSIFRREMSGSGRNLASAKDIAQYAVIESYGGVGLDCDVIVKKRVGQLKSHSGILIYRKDNEDYLRFNAGYVADNPDDKVDATPEISNAVIAAMPHHGAIQKTISHINHSYRGNSDHLPEVEFMADNVCNIYCAFSPDLLDITQEESIQLLRKQMGVDKRFGSYAIWVDSKRYASARFGLTVAATGPGALRCGVGRTVALEYKEKDYSFERPDEMFGFVAENMNDAILKLREGKIQNGLLGDGESWVGISSNARRRRDSF